MTSLIVISTEVCIVPAQRRALNENSSVECSTKKAEQSSCERTKQILDLALVKVQEAKNAPLTVLIRLGSREKSKTLVMRRKDFIRNYLLSTRLGAIEKDNLIFREGQKNDKLGKVELYINNEIVGEVFYLKNAENPCKKETY